MTPNLVLGLLCRGPGHGYALEQRFAQLTGGVWRLSRATVYHALRALADQGLVETLAAAGARGGPDKRTYRLTATGRARVAAWLQRPPARPWRLRPEILARLSALTQDDLAEALRQLELEQGLYRGHLRSLRDEIAGGETPSSFDAVVHRASLDAAARAAAVHIDWIDDLRAECLRLQCSPGTTGGDRA